MDKEKADDLYQRLKQVRHKPWMDTEDIYPGEKFALAIEKAIRDSDFFVVCLSSHSVNRRGFIQRELREALDLWREKLDSDIYLLPVRLEECEMPDSLKDFQWLDLFAPNGWDRLLKAIEEGMRRRQSP
jgi:hypothetical protein